MSSLISFPLHSRNNYNCNKIVIRLSLKKEHETIMILKEKALRKARKATLDMSILSIALYPAHYPLFGKPVERTSWAFNET